MNRKDRRRQAKLGQPAPASAPSPAGGFGAADALAYLTHTRPTVPLPQAAAPAARPPSALPAPQALETQGEQDFARAVYYRFLDALRTRSADTVIAALAEIVAQVERLWSGLRPQVEARKTPGFACAAGCAWCCYQQVAVEPAEALTIARHIATRLSPETRAALERRLAEVDARTRGLGIVARARLRAPCAFLADGRCSIYEVRPLRCRGVYSRDADHCRWAMENPDDYFAGRGQRDGAGPYPVEPTRIARSAVIGLHRAAKEFGVSERHLELVAAVRTALAEPDAGARYLAGEPVFAAATLPERDDPPPAAQRG